jgi:L-fuculose-phosphate aldolase
MVLDREDLIRIKYVDGRLEVPSGSKPSGELHMHHLLLENSAKLTRAVLHVHPTHVIAAMYRGFDLQLLATHFPEIFRYTRVGPTVPPIPAVTKELGDATAEAFGVTESGLILYDIVGQANHGVCSIGDDPWSAFEHIERLDHICQIVLVSGVTPEMAKTRKALEF